MSHDMRPEVRLWGPAACVFVSAKTAIDLLAAVSQADPGLGMEYADDVSHEVYRVRWENGAAILHRFAEMDERLMSFAIAEVEELHGKPVENEPDALTFFPNLHACAEAGRECVDPDDGSFALRLDA